MLFTVCNGMEQHVDGLFKIVNFVNLWIKTPSKVGKNRLLVVQMWIFVTFVAKSAFQIYYFV